MMGIFFSTSWSCDSPVRQRFCRDTQSTNLTVIFWIVLDIDHLGYDIYSDLHLENKGEKLNKWILSFAI